MSSFDDVATPALILDRSRLGSNIDTMARRAAALGVPLRPHGKTPKCGDVARLLIEAGAVGLTVSTLREAEGYFAAGVADLFYAVALAPAKVERAAALIARGAALTCLIDHREAISAIGGAAASADATLPLVVELDVDGYRSGASPGDVVALARTIADHDNLRFAGVMSYGGASYGCTPSEVAGLAETHRLALVEARDDLRAAGLPCGMVSFGSTPAVLHARSMEGMTELRCGIYAFQDLFQAAIGACTIDDIALSVLTTVIGVRRERNRVVVDAGGLAMSKDLSTARTSHDAGYGLVCDIDGMPMPDVHMSTTSQELGLLTTFSGAPLPFGRLRIGDRVRVLPNHADMTAAAHDGYHVIGGPSDGIDYWKRFNGW